MRIVMLALIASVAVAGLLFWQAGPETGRAGDDPLPDLIERAAAGQQEAEFAERQIVVRFNRSASGAAVRSLNEAFGATTVEEQPRSGLRRLSLPVGADVDRVLKAYRDHPLVAEAGRSRLAHATGAPDDTNYSYQWHLHDTVGGVWAESAWGLSPTAGQGVVVAVIDTGVAYESFTGPGGLSTQTFAPAPDLAGKTFVAPFDFFNNDAHANDDNGHGTHVAGTIAQDTNNAFGVAGVAHNATIMPVKALAFDGTGPDADLVEGIYHAVDNGADVINMSAGFPGTGMPDVNGAYCTEIVGLPAALDYAYANGVVVVAAAGNEAGTAVNCPAAYPTVIAVGATRFDGQAAPYSNQGTTLDISAPGGDPNVDQNGDGFSDGVVQETYCDHWFGLLLTGVYDTFCDVFMSGTSMAAPHVTGAAALLLGAAPSLTPNQVRSYLESTARDRGTAGWDPVYGWGALDARAALTALLADLATPTPSPTPCGPAGCPTATPTPTATPKPPGPKLSLDVKTAGVSPAGGCAAVPKEPSCDAVVGTPVTLSVMLSQLDLPDLDGDTVAGYAGFQARVTFDTALVYKDRAGTSEIVWPDCEATSAAELVSLGSYLAGCSTTGSESSYLGAVLQMDFTCVSPGDFLVTLVPGAPSDTHLLNELGSGVAPAKGDSVTIRCLAPTPTPTPLPNVDSDGDGCLDTDELGPDPQLGGGRDPLNFWDFFDTIDPNATPVRDGVVSIGDVFRVVARFGTTGDPNIDPLSPPPPGMAYHTSYDRAPPPTAAQEPDPTKREPWDLRAADGVISIGDVLGAVSQFGHNCA